MTHRTWSWLLFLIPGLVAAQPAAPPDAPASRVAALIAQLGSPRITEREEATRSLDVLGPAALEALRTACTSTDAEVVRRATDLVGRIERRQLAAQLLAPRHVHLVCRDTPVPDAVTELARQSGYPLQFAGNERTRLMKRRITLDTGLVSFWEALEQLCRKAGLTERHTGPAHGAETRILDAQNGVIIQQRLIVRGYNPYAMTTDRAVVLADGTPAAAPTHHAGAVRIRALPPNAWLRSQPKGSGEILLALEVTPEPHLPWQGVLDVRVARAVDEHGQELDQASSQRMPSPAAAALMGNNAVFVDMGDLVPASQAGQTPVRLKGGEKPTRRLQQLQGTVTVQVETPVQALLTMDDILNATGQTVQGVDGGSLKIHEAARQDNGRIKVKVELQVPPTGLDVFNPLRAPRPVNRVRVVNGAVEVGTAEFPLKLLDAKGRDFTLVRAEQTRLAFGNALVQEYTLLYQPRPGQGDPAKLVYLGRRSVALEIPFALKDVALP